ncbi:MAG: hypothetical protein DMF21_06835 [Verrucomicrobia bacterium]|nr:MAG: hypothetical protein DMF21_06835 [Verrucomicrobiota bacterium]
MPIDAGLADKLWRNAMVPTTKLGRRGNAGPAGRAYALLHYRYFHSWDVQILKCIRCICWVRIGDTIEKRKLFIAPPIEPREKK